MSTNEDVLCVAESTFFRFTTSRKINEFENVYVSIKMFELNINTNITFFLLLFEKDSSTTQGNFNEPYCVRWLNDERKIFLCGNNDSFQGINIISIHVLFFFIPVIWISLHNVYFALQVVNYIRIK